MEFTFDGSQRRILLPSGATTVEARDLYSQWKAWVSLGVFAGGAQYLPAFRVVGGDPLTGDLAMASYFFLLNGWRVKPAEEDGEINVVGNLLVDGGGNPLVSPDGNYRVLAQFTVPVQAEAVNSQNVYKLDFNNNLITPVNTYK